MATVDYDLGWVRMLADEVQADAEYRKEARQLDAAFVLGFGECHYLVAVRRGEVEALVEAPTVLDRRDFALVAPTATWDRLLAAVPEPMSHDVFACVATGSMALEGDVLVFLRHLPAVQRWVKVARRLRSGADATAAAPTTGPYRAVGRYVDVAVAGRTHKVFYFESGPDEEGATTLLCQHTAGSDNRQWRNLLEDAELAAAGYRVVAYDLPRHGKSEPPSGVAWWEEDAPLTSAWATDFVVALADALGLDRPVFVGSSIGGVMALHLAARHPGRFRGFVSFSAALGTAGFYHDWWTHPGLNAAVVVGAISDGIVAPQTPEADRRLTDWYQSANPRVLRDDLYLWGVDNADLGLAERIDAEATPVHLLTGEYDYACPPELSQATAEAIGSGATFTRMEGIGHFPMSEDYPTFRAHLLRVLDDVRRRTS